MFTPLLRGAVADLGVVGMRHASPIIVHFFQFHNVFAKYYVKQECIPVGCVPSAAVAISPGGGGLSAARGCLLRRGLLLGGGCLLLGGGCLLIGVCLLPGVGCVSAPGVVCSGGCLPQGSAPGVVVFQHALRQTPPMWTDRHL